MAVDTHFEFFRTFPSFCAHDCFHAAVSHKQPVLGHAVKVHTAEIVQSKIASVPNLRKYMSFILVLAQS